MEKILSTKRKVILKDIEYDDMDSIKDLLRFGKEVDGYSGVYNIHKFNTAWIRNGLAGGDFDGWKPNGVAPPDHVLKQLTGTERDELAELIKECQIINPKKPSSSA